MFFLIQHNLVQSSTIFVITVYKASPIIKKNNWKSWCYTIYNTLAVNITLLWHFIALCLWLAWYTDYNLFTPRGRQY